VKTQASSIPETIEIQRYFDKLQVYLRRNIEQIDVTNEEAKETRKEFAFDEVSFMIDDVAKVSTAKTSVTDEKSLMAFVGKNFDEIFAGLEKAEYNKTVEVVNKYLERKWLKQSEVDAYVGSGLILAKDVKK
jgi:hypothetical protein